MSSDLSQKSYLGTGWGFPPEFGPNGGDVAMVSDLEDVQQSLRILLATRQGERPMQELFGCNLDSVMFDKINHGTVNRIQTVIYTAVLTHEPRVRPLNIDVSADPNQAGVLRISLDYEVPAANSRFNMVFPFYLNESVVVG